MKRSFAILLALLMSLNTAAAVYAEDGTEIMISADEEIIMEEILAEEFGDAEVIEVSDAAGLKTALETPYNTERTVRLTGDITDLAEPITIPGDGAPIILNMNGCTLGTSEDWAGKHWMLVNWGDLTIIGEGVFTLGEGVGIVVNNVGTLTIESGTFSGFTPVSADSGTLTVKGGTFNAEGEGAQVFGIRSGTIEITGNPVCSGDVLFGFVDTNNELTIKGGTYTAFSNVFYTMEGVEGTPKISIEGGKFTMGESTEVLLAALQDYIAGGATVTVNDMIYTKDAIPEEEPEEEERPEIPDGDKLNGELFGSDSWEKDSDTSFEKAFDDDISTFYDAYAATIDAHVGMEVGTATRLTEVHIVPRNANGYDPEVTVLEKTDGYNNEEADNLFDRDLKTKWCAPGQEHSVIWQVERPMAVYGYQMYTANDTREASGRNPFSWTLWGSNDGKDWVVIDEQVDNDEIPAENYTLYEVFLEERTTAYEYFKLTIDELVGAEEFQLSEFRLVESPEECIRMEGMTIQGGNADDTRWVDLYTFPNDQVYYVQDYVVTADDMNYVNKYSFTQFRVINKQQHFNVAEVEFYGVDGSDMPLLPELSMEEHNLNEDAILFGSKAWKEDREFDKAFDGNIETGYDAYDNSWQDAEIGIRLENPAQLTGIKVHPCGDGNEYRLINLTVQGSVNGNDWITLYQFDDVQDYEYRYYEISAEKLASAAQDYAFTQFRVMSKSEHLNVAEVEFHGTYDHSLETFPTEFDEPIYSYLTAKQFLDTNWVYYERNPENDDYHYLDYWYFNEVDEEGMTRFEREFAGRNPIVLVGGVGFDETVLEIQDIDNQPIIAVTPHAFSGEDGIVKVIVNESSDCKYIMNNAFRFCKNLETVTVSNSLRNVECWAFDETPKLSKFIKDGAPLTDEQKDECGWNFVEVYDGVLVANDNRVVAYPQGKAYVENYEVPYFIQEIDHGAFRYANIGRITMGDYVYRVCNWAFAGCTAHTIELSPSLKYLGEDVFSECTNLTTLVIPSDDVELDRWMEEDDNLTDDKYMFSPWLFEWTNHEDRTEPLTVHAYAGSVIEEYVDYTKSLDLSEFNPEYDMSHVVFAPYTGVHWICADWFEECGENEVFLVGYSAPLNAEITTMPTETYDGKTIIGVTFEGEWSAFCRDDRVGGTEGTFTVPEGIRYLHGRPFAECKNLTALVLPASLERVDALNDRVPNLEKFEVAADSKHFYTRDDGASLYSGDTYVSFAPASGRDEIEILPGTRSIGYSAFQNVDGIKTVIVPESVESVENWAFQNSSLESITLPGKVNYIGEEAFADCLNLTTVTINSFRDEFRVEGNVFANSNPIIYVYAGTCAAETMLEGRDKYGWNVVVNDVTETIYDTYTTNDGVHLAKVYAKPGDTVFTIPEDVQVIDDRAFEGITGITKVVFPENLRYIGHEVFTGCAENFTAEFAGAVQLYQEDDAFDNGFKLETYTEYYQDFDDNGDPTGLFYRLNPSTEEAMVNAWWYNAINDEGVLNVPAIVTVPGENGDTVYTVVAIEDSALAGYTPDIVAEKVGSDIILPAVEGTYPKSIVLPDSIRYIGSGAMGSQTYDMWTGKEYGLTSIKLPASVQYIAEDFVFACWNIESYTGLDDYGDENSDNPYRLAYGKNEKGENVAVVVNTWDEIVLHAYPQGNAATEFIMPAGIEVIGRNAVRDAQNLTRVNLTEGNSLYRIADQAFCNCGKLERVMIPSSLRDIEHGPFTECHSLVAFDIPNGNDTFDMHPDGTLRMGRKGETIAVLPLGNIPGHGIYRISDDVYDIKDGAAKGSRNLTELTIPANVRDIYDWAFAECGNLRKVTIEGTLDYFSIDTFAWARNLEEIVYCGESLNMHYYSHDNFQVSVQIDEDGNEVHDENGNCISDKFDLVCLNENCEVRFFVVDGDYDNEENREYLNVDDNEYFNLIHKTGPVYETYTDEDGVHLSRVYNVSGDVVIPPEVMIIDDRAFAGIKGITSVTFPKNLHYIGREAFKDCGEFKVHFTGAVQIDSEDDSFDFDFGAVYGEAFFDNQHWDGEFLYYLMPEAEEAMLRGYWYTAIDQTTGEMEIPSEIKVETEDGEVTYKVTAIEPGSCEAGSADRLGDHVREHAEKMGWSIEDREWTYDYPKSVIIPNTVRYIGWNAFAGHGYWNEVGDYGLESVTLPAELVFLPCDAFWDCYQIKEFKGLDTFGSESENPYQLYNGSVINTWGPNDVNDILMLYPPECGKTEYTVPGDIEIIGENAFRWAEELTTLTLEEGVRVLRDHAVILTGLETLTIPNSLEEIHGNALAYNRYMKTFIVNNHPWLSVHDDNTLRMEGGEKLVAYPTGTIENGVLEIKAESGIKRISNIGMAGIGIEKLILSEKIEQIDDWAFTNNDDLKTVIINGTIDTMNLDVFADCDNMETIIYNGEYINVYYYDGDNFTIARESDTPRKIDFIMPNNTDSIKFFVAYDHDFNNRKEGVHTPADNPYFNLLSEIPESEAILGDINGDGRVDTRDRMTLARTLANWDNYPMENLKLAAADIDGDGEITTTDRMILARYLAKWIGYESLENPIQ